MSYPEVDTVGELVHHEKETRSVIRVANGINFGITHRSLLLSLESRNAEGNLATTYWIYILSDLLDYDSFFQIAQSTLQGDRSINRHVHRMLRVIPKRVLISGPK